MSVRLQLREDLDRLMDRNAFLARVRSATGGLPPTAAPDALRRLPGDAPAGPGASVVERGPLMDAMCARWHRQSAQCHLVSAADAAAAVAGILLEHRARCIAVSRHRLLDELGVPGTLARHALEILPHPTTDDRAPAAFASADAGISVADYGVAETGTLVEAAGPEQARTCSLLPSLHVALLRERDLLPTLDDLFARLEQAPLSGAVIFISGPSGTADIGMQHVVGVHGPGEVHLVLVRD